MTEISTSILPTDDTGDGVSGTIFNRAYFVALKAAIDALIHSSTNPTITPEDIIDEVKTARGSLSSLNSRLGVSLNADGSLVSLPDIGEGLLFTGTAGQDIVKDELCFLSRGDGGLNAGQWYKCDANVDYKSSTGILFGFANANIATAASGLFTVLGEHTFTVSAKTGLLVPGTLYVISTTQGDISTSGGTHWKAIAVAKDANTLYITPSINSVIAARDTLVSYGGTTESQIFYGLKSFNKTPKANYYGPNFSNPLSQVAYHNNTTVGNVGSGEDNLMGFALGPNDFAEGVLYRVTAWGYFAANANAKQVKLKLGATTILASTSSAEFNGLNWKIVADILGTGATAQKSYVQWICPGTATLGLSTLLTRTVTAIAIALFGSTLQITGEAVADNDIVQEGMTFEVLNGV